MKQGYVTASVFIGKLQSYPRQNNLTYVLPEYVVLWNTVYKQEVLKEMESEGEIIDPDDIGHLSPARFTHINRFGKYSFELNANKYDSSLRELRRHSLE